MAKCPYCNKSAGIFRKRHKDCETKHSVGITEIRQRLKSFFFGEKTPKDQILLIVQNSFISQAKLDEIFENVYSNRIDSMLEDDLLSEEEETLLAEYQNFYNIKQDILNKNNAVHRVVGASILRKLFNNEELTSQFNINGNLPFKFLKNESLIFLYPKTLFSEERTKTEYEGCSSGVSIRIAKGLYYRTSAFKGRPVKKEFMTPIDYGMMALTNKHLYFSSTKKSFRIRYDRIITLNPHSDGIGIHKDSVSSKPMIFSEIDGWFCYNFIKNIEKYEQG